MRIHIALYKFKSDVANKDIREVFKLLAELGPKVPGLIGITCATNDSKYSDGYDYVIFVRGRNQAAIDTYRAHPLHQEVAKKLDIMEDRGIGVDFTVDS